MVNDAAEGRKAKKTTAKDKNAVDTAAGRGAGIAKSREAERKVAS